jgi:dTDP-glucose 4,6-dehydratase
MPDDLEQDLEHVLKHTAFVWQRLAGSNIFITGGTGFVGSWLIESLLSANREFALKTRLFALTRDPHAFRLNRPHLAQNADVELLCGDLKTFPFPSQQMHYILHAAIEHDNAVAANLQATRRVLEMARVHGTRRLLFTSSGAIYGKQPAEIDNIPESFAGLLDPHNAYAQSKCESEALCAQGSGLGLDVVIARLFAFVGPYLPLDRNFAVGNFIRDAAMGGPIRIAGDGTPLRSYLYAADLAIWLWTLLVNGKPARPYNVGSDRAISILELARMVEKVCDVRRGISIAKTPAPGEKPRRYVPSIDRARTELKLEPLIPLDEGIRRTFTWRQRNPA